ncbi:MAG: carboxymuconolactone decarboxylase family protein [Novosphingobium sp.]
MHQPDPPARLPPIRDEEFTDQTRAFFDRWTVGIFRDAHTNPVLCTFAHHPALADAFSQLNVHLLSANTLPVKERQIAIMRTAWLTKATYMWSSHLNTSKLVGLTDEMYGPIQRGADDPYFTQFERTVILATEDLVNDYEVSQANWTALRAEWNEQQMLDFLFTVGCYVMVAGVMRSTGAERQDDLLELAERYGAP